MELRFYSIVGHKNFRDRLWGYLQLEITSSKSDSQR